MANSATAGVTPSLAYSRPFAGIVVSGVIVGVLDLAYATAVYSPHRPIIIPQTIASGVLGLKSYQEGIESAALGVLLHFVIALGAATIYYLASRKLTFLVRRAVPCGLLYGAGVYLFMHLVVLPLSAAPSGHTPLTCLVAEFVEHCFCVGLPIALSVRHYSR